MSYPHKECELWFAIESTLQLCSGLDMKIVTSLGEKGAISNVK
jgi:hypothetical protein